ncbi:MAG: hypothetical protein NVS4B3_01760 [Gemmatimonadaceae bacterium]
MLLFSGVAEVDAEREQIVRLRGRFLIAGGRPTLGDRLTALSFEAVAYAELENAEVEGSYWLPSYQRLEFQATSFLASESRMALRIVSRFRDYAVDERPESRPTVTVAGALVVDRTALYPRRLTFARRDSTGRFDRWERELGRATADTRTTDFDDVGPDRLRATGAARLDWRSRRLADVARFNRVEGAFTGVAGSFTGRNAVPGATLYASAGRAWGEEAFKGGVRAELVRDRWAGWIAAERELVTTNDFRPLFDGGASLGALLFTVDDYDYVDRRGATIGLRHELNGVGGATLRLEAGAGSDQPELRRIMHGLFHGDSIFRENRGVEAGRYAREALTLDWSPTITGDYLEAGIGGRLSYEHAHGGLHWQRLEGELALRRRWGAVTTAVRGDVGALLGSGRPPQQLFELGSGEGLYGYDYKEFGGDRAARMAGSVRYGLPLWRAPIHLWRFILPGPSPALSLGAVAGWAAASNAATEEALRALGVRIEPQTTTAFPVSRPTDGVRATTALQVVFFGGFAIGVGRAVDHTDQWRLVIGRY